MSYYGCLVMHYQQVPDLDAKEKTIQTTCKEITTLRLDWNGAREITSERIIWQTNVVMRLEWMATVPPKPPVTVSTNDWTPFTRWLDLK